VGCAVRPAKPEDARAVGELARKFAAYLRQLGDRADFQFDAKAYLRDGFGPNPAFSGLVAETHEQLVGYLLYHPGYDTDRAVRILHIVDLYVDEPFRRQRIARALMEDVARIGREIGAQELFWSVYELNGVARAFYERLGAKYTKDLKFMHWRA